MSRAFPFFDAAPARALVLNSGPPHTIIGRPFGTPPFVTSSQPTISVRAFSARFTFAEALPFRFLRIINTKRLNRLLTLRGYLARRERRPRCCHLIYMSLAG